MSWLDQAHVWSMLTLLWVGTPIQVLFCLLFFTRKWHRYKFSRALMWKSGALALYMYAGASKVAVAGLRGYDWPWWIDAQTVLINVLVFWAIINQLWALISEIRLGDDNAAQSEVDAKR